MLQDFKQCKIVIFYAFISIVSLFVWGKLILEVLKEINTKMHVCSVVSDYLQPNGL